MIKLELFVIHYKMDVGRSDFRLYDSSDLLMSWWGPDALAVCQAHLGKPVGFLLIQIQFNLLLSPYRCFISLLYLDLYVLGDDALISYGSFMQTKYLSVLIHI